MRVYLAGPDVFLPNPADRAAALKTICARHGLIGVSPLDAVPHEPAAWADLPLGRRIALCNEAHIAASAALIANLTPFRGPSADVGTVFELGFARALNRPVFGWTNTATPFAERSRVMFGASQGADGVWRDADGLTLEDFGMHDNLMIDGAILSSGGMLFAREIPRASRWTDLSVFEMCVERVARLLSTGSENPGG
jgi:nucleoside 2-deoxyribosyltransferase